MIFAIYFFVIRISKNKNEALINGLILGFVMYGIYDGTLYAVFPIKDYNTAFLDVTWGTLLCGTVSYLSY